MVDQVLEDQNLDVLISVAKSLSQTSEGWLTDRCLDAFDDSFAHLTRGLLDGELEKRLCMRQVELYIKILT